MSQGCLSANYLKLICSFLKSQGKKGFPDSSVGKESACNAGNPGSIPGSGRSTGEGTATTQPVFLGFPDGSAGRIHLQCERPGFHLWVGKIPWRRKRLPTPVSWPEECHGLYSPWGHKGSDTTEQFSLSLYFS